MNKCLYCVYGGPLHSGLTVLYVLPKAHFFYKFVSNYTIYICSVEALSCWSTCMYVIQNENEKCYYSYQISVRTYKIFHNAMESMYVCKRQQNIQPIMYSPIFNQSYNLYTYLELIFQPATQP